MTQQPEESVDILYPYLTRSPDKSIGSPPFLPGMTAGELQNSLARVQGGCKHAERPINQRAPTLKQENPDLPRTA